MCSPRSARSRYTTVRHSAPRGDFRPATGSETHVFGRVCSHNTICLPSSSPSSSHPSLFPFFPLPALALQCVPYSMVEKKKEKRAHRVHVIRAYRVVSLLLRSFVRSLVRLFRSKRARRKVKRSHEREKTTGKITSKQACNYSF